MPAIMEARQNVRQMLGAWWRIALDGAVLAAAPAPSRSGAVCIVHLGAIGDFVLWLDAGRHLSRHYRESGSRLVLVANAAWAPWARELELADEVWEIDPTRFDRDFGHRAYWLRRVRAEGFDTVLQPTHSRTATSGDSLVRASAAPARIGSAGDCANTPARLKRRADAWYTRLIACGDASRMELLRNADFMRGLGFTDFRARGPELGGGLPANPAGLAHKSYAVLVPGAGVEWRAWPVASFAEVGRRLAARGLGVVIAGGTGDRAVAAALLRELGGHAEDFAGRSTLGETAAILAGARLVVSNETAAAHIAAAVGTPAVCVLGGGHYGRFLPYAVEEGRDRRIPPIAVAHKMDCYGCNWSCIYPRGPGEPVQCIKEITPEAVWRQVEACLARDCGPR
jgi:ADP-heptose:LPS heptosyltransferase